MFEKASRRRLLLVAGAMALGMLCQCNTPTLPLPPPGTPEVSLGTDGYAVVVGGDGSVASYAQVVGFNTTNGNGVGTTASAKGAYSMKLKASSGDIIELWQRSGEVQSPSTSVVVH